MGMVARYTIKLVYQIDGLNKFQSGETTVLWNNALLLDAAKYVTSFNQSECIISL